jgi:hypothetical protein
MTMGTSASHSLNLPLGKAHAVPGCVVVQVCPPNPGFLDTLVHPNRKQDYELNPANVRCVVFQTDSGFI